MKDFTLYYLFKMQTNALLIRQNFIVFKKRVLQTYPPEKNLAHEIQEALGNNLG
jgi:hypothetical protein